MIDRGRLEALDAFRGLAVAAMILVSTPGNWEAVYWPLDHAAWHGWTPTDLVFPFFLFAMGAAVPIALTRRRGQRRPLLYHVGLRALVLFALGLLLNLIKAPTPIIWSTFRIPGVLQRIAIVYIAVAWITGQASRRVQITATVALLLGYWAAMTFVPVPGIGAGVLTQDGNLAGFVDRALLRGHVAFGTWDPEGLLSTIPAVATALCGVFAGDWLVQRGGSRHASLWLWATGAAATLVGLLWDGAFPINKNLWTSSYVLFSGGIAAQLLALCHWVLDVRSWKSWALPFVAFGRNALAAYFLSIALDTAMTRWALWPFSDESVKSSLYSAAFGSWLTPCCGAELASLSYAVVYVAFWALIMIAMYRRGVFVRI